MTCKHASPLLMPPRVLLDFSSFVQRTLNAAARANIQSATVTETPLTDLGLDGSGEVIQVGTAAAHSEVFVCVDPPNANYTDEAMRLLHDLTNRPADIHLRQMQEYQVLEDTCWRFLGVSLF